MTETLTKSDQELEKDEEDALNDAPDTPSTAKKDSTKDAGTLTDEATLFRVQNEAEKLLKRIGSTMGTMRTNMRRLAALILQGRSAITYKEHPDWGAESQAARDWFRKIDAVIDNVVAEEDRGYVRRNLRYHVQTVLREGYADPEHPEYSFQAVPPALLQSAGIDPRTQAQRQAAKAQEGEATPTPPRERQPSDTPSASSEIVPDNILGRNGAPTEALAEVAGRVAYALEERIPEGYSEGAKGERERIAKLCDQACANLTTVAKRLRAAK